MDNLHHRTVFDNRYAIAYSRDGIVILLAKLNMKNGVHVRLESGKTERLGPMRPGSTKQLKGRPVGVMPMSSIAR